MKIRHHKKLFLALCVCSVLASAQENAEIPSIDPTHPGLQPDVGVPISSEITSVSQSIGEIGYEISRLPRSPDKSASELAESIYANIDEIAFNAEGEDHVLKSLGQAAQLRKSIFLESSLWDIAKLEKVARKLFPESYIPSEDSAIMLAIWTPSGWSFVREYDEIVSDLSLDRSSAKLSVSDPERSKTLGGNVTISWLWKFTNATYFVDWRIPNYVQKYRPADNTYAIWEGGFYNPGKCVVAWRGSISAADWLITDAANWFTSYGYGRLFDVPFDIWNFPVLGQGYHLRFDNRRDRLASELTKAGCDDISITGHSLGGGMALYHAYRWSFISASYRNLASVVAFNPSRLGNNTATNQLRNIQNGTGGLEARPIKSYCRTGDIVKGLPENFAEFCTYTGVQARAFGSGSLKAVLEANHDYVNWSKCTALDNC